MDLEHKLSQAQELLAIKTLMHYKTQCSAYSETHPVEPHTIQTLLDDIQDELSTPALRYLNATVVTEDEETTLNGGTLPASLEYIEHAYFRKATMRGFALNYTTQQYSRVLYGDNLQAAIDVLSAKYRLLRTTDLTADDISELVRTVRDGKKTLQSYIDVPTLLSVQHTIYSDFLHLRQSFDKYNSSFLYHEFDTTKPVPLMDFLTHVRDDISMSVLFTNQPKIVVSAPKNDHQLCSVRSSVEALYKEYVYFTESWKTTIGPKIVDIQTRPTEPLTAWVRKIGHYIVKQASLCIDDNIIDVFDSDFINIQHELQPNQHPRGYCKMIGDVAELTSMTSAPTPSYRLYVPIPFFVNKTPLPIVAITHHDVLIKIKLASFDECFHYNSSTQLVVQKPLHAALVLNYISLEESERNLFVQKKHDLLVETVECNQPRMVHPVPTDVRLYFSHPCKEIFWILQPDTTIASKQYHQYLVDGTSCLLRAKLKIMGIDRTAWHSAPYFESVIPAATHHSSPQGIGLYSFALNPEALQPSGMCPFDAIDEKHLCLHFTDSLALSDVIHVKVWSRSYNVLRVMGGQAALLY